MQGVVGLAVFVSLLGYIVLSDNAPESVPIQVSAEAGVSVARREPLHFARPSSSESAPLPVQVAEKAEPAKKVTPVVVPIFRPLPPPPPPPEPVAPVAPFAPQAPAQDPAITACLGKVASEACTYTAEGATHSGTCITPSWSPLTCIAFQ